MTETRKDPSLVPVFPGFIKPSKPRQQAVIDIGSNSVRLIVYQVAGRSITPRINEKVMAGLGADLAETGLLSEGGVIAALDALSRYTAICHSLGVTDITAIATAAARDARDGQVFCDAVKKRCGLSVRVLSGAEEARYAALGVVAAQRRPSGLIGDLGGSSLELVETKDGQLGEGKTYKLGPLALEAYSDVVNSKLESRVRKELRSQGKHAKTDRFYAVGGAWRAIAKLHMVETGYPLQVLQSYAIPSADIIALCERLMDAKSKQDPVVKSVSGRRAATLGHTALTLKCVLEEIGATCIITSAYGLREGVIYEGMDAVTRNLDPLLAGVANIARTGSGQLSFARALSSFVEPALKGLSPVFDGDPAIEDRLHSAAFIASDLGGMLHPDHRADIARQLILRGPYTGVDHRGRVYLGLLMGLRYYRKFEPTALETSVLSPEQIDRARTTAMLIRVAAEFSARTERILRRASLQKRANELVFSVPSRHSDLVSEGVVKRLGHAAAQLGLTPVIGPLISQE